MLSFRAFRHKKIVVKCIANYLNEAKKYGCNWNV